MSLASSSLGSNDEETNQDQVKNDSILQQKAKRKKKRKSPNVAWKKPKDMPKRPLSAYNLFFKKQRKEMIYAREALSNSNPPTTKKKSKKKTVGIGFANLAKVIADKWQTMENKEKNPYVEQAAKEKARYKEEIQVWRAKQKDMKKFEGLAALSTMTSRKRHGPSNAVSLQFNESINYDRNILDDARMNQQMSRSGDISLHRLHSRQNLFIQYPEPSSMDTLKAPTYQLPGHGTSSSPWIPDRHLLPPGANFNQQQQYKYHSPLEIPQWSSPFEGTPHLGYKSQPMGYRGELSWKMTPTSNVHLPQGLEEGQSKNMTALKKRPPFEGGTKPLPSSDEARDVSLDNLASRLDNDSIQFLAGFQFSNSPGDREPETTEAKKL
jgi:hypothetical protein